MSQSVSYFVTEVFRGIVFPDRHIAVRSNTGSRRRVVKQVAVGGGVLALTLFIVLPALAAYLNDVDLVRATSEEVQSVARSERGGASRGAESLDLLLDRVQQLNEAKSRFRIRGWWGSQAAVSLYQPVQEVYLRRLRAVVEGPVRDQIRSNVRTIGDSVRTDAQHFRSSYDNLKLYVMMTTPEHLDVEWANTKLAEEWARSVRADGKTESDRLKGHAKSYVEALSADRAMAWSTEESMLARARARLSRQPVEELQYGWLVGNAEDVPPIRPEKVFYGPAALFVTTRSKDVMVPGVYTAAGWDKVRAALDSTSEHLVIEPWVLGTVVQGAGDPRETSAERLRELYFRRYQHAWSEFLGGLVVQGPTDIRSAIEELNALSENEGPYTRLFRVLSDNVRLDIESTAEKAVGKGKDLAVRAIEKLTGKDAEALKDRNVSTVEIYFKPLLRFAFGDSAGKPDAAPSKLSQYLMQINNLAVALRALAESKAEPTAEFRGELARTGAAVEALLFGLDAGTRLLLEPFLMNPIRGSRAQVAISGNVALDDKWKAEVFEMWRTKLAGRYPFGEAAQDVTVPEFAEFFRPQTGVLWNFYGKNLADRLERTGNTFAAKASADPIPFRPDFLKCLGHAQEITDAVFGAGPEPVVPFQLKMQPVGRNVSEVTFRLDDQAVVYRNEPERWIPIQWPGKAPPRGAVLQVKGAGFTDEIPRMGDFGIFRLLAYGGLKPAGSDGILAASWNLTRAGEAPVVIQVKPGKSAQPFGRDFFRRLNCPADATLSSAGGGGRAP